MFSQVLFGHSESSSEERRWIVGWFHGLDLLDGVLYFTACWWRQRRRWRHMCIRVRWAQLFDQSWHFLFCCGYSLIELNLNGLYELARKCLVFAQLRSDLWDLFNFLVCFSFLFCLSPFLSCIRRQTCLRRKQQFAHIAMVTRAARNFSLEELLVSFSDL